MNNIPFPHSAMSLKDYSEEKQKEEMLQNLQAAGAKANIEILKEIKNSNSKSNIALLVSILSFFVGFASLIVSIIVNL